MYAAIIIIIIGVGRLLVSLQPGWINCPSKNTVILFVNNFFILLFIAVLASTGSRAGWLALGGGLGILAFGRVVTWRTASVVGSVLLVAILFIPVAKSRLVQDPTVDTSIAIRFELWRSVTALISDHPWFGVGIDNFMPTLNRRYLSDALGHRFATGLNDGLTLAGAYGLPILGVVGSAIGSIAGVLTAHFRNPNVSSSYAQTVSWISAAVVMAILISGQFQGHLWAWREVQTMAMIAVCGMFGGMAWSWKFHPRAFRWVGPLCGGVLGATLPIGLIVLFAISSDRPRSLYTQSMTGGLWVRPQVSAHLRTAVIAVSSKKGTDFLLQRWLRPLLSAGWSLQVHDDMAWVQAPYRTKLNTEMRPKPSVILAWGDMATPLLHTESTIPIVVINPEGDPPNTAVSTTPVLVLLARSAPFVDLDAWRAWAGIERVHVFKRSQFTAEYALPIIDQWLSETNKAQ